MCGFKEQAIIVHVKYGYIRKKIKIMKNISTGCQDWIPISNHFLYPDNFY